MKQYDIKCPVCGTVNYGLFLQETDGRMECEHCGTESHVLTMKPLRVIPCVRKEGLSAIGKRIAANI